MAQFKAVDPEIVQFFQDFYRATDTPGQDEKYVAMMTEDATVIVASGKAHGHDEVKVIRRNVWSIAACAKHVYSKIIPIPDSSDEFMLYGSTKATLKNGLDREFDWAARFQLVKSPSDEKWRICFYQTYLDTGIIEDLDQILQPKPYTGAGEVKAA